MDETVRLETTLPVGSVTHHAPGWWGMWTLIATEASLFAYLLFSYAYLAVLSDGKWVAEMPKFDIALPNTVILIASSFLLRWGETGIRKGKKGRLLASLGGTFVMGSVFVVLQWVEWGNKKFQLSSSAYGSSFFVTTGFHMAHVVGGLIVIAVLFLWALQGLFSEERHSAVAIGALYWHFVDVVWLAVFSAYYISPYLSS